MKDIYYKFLKLFARIETKIAFYPSVISLAGLVFAILIYYAEGRGLSKYLLDTAPFLVIDDIETARTLLSVFIGGLISIMVFSFSMVMILLNNAASNFSPRVLPGLISNRRHQFILGIYNSSLLYCIFTLMTLDPTGDKYQLPGFSVLLAIVGMVTCLGAFIYFIHSISQEIQVDNIMKKIYGKAESRIKELMKIDQQNSGHHAIDSSDFLEITSVRSGYFQDIAEKGIMKLTRENDLKIDIVPIKGTYIYEDDVILRVNKEVGDELKENIRDQFVFSNNELVEDNYILAFKQITEIAVKAMSPGINDPGTAINAIDYLTELFLTRLKTSDHSFYVEGDTARIKFRVADFEKILYNVMASLRTYASHDVILANKMLFMLSTLLKAKDTHTQKYKLAIVKEMKNLADDVNNNINNKRDVEQFQKNLESLKEHLPI